MVPVCREEDVHVLASHFLERATMFGGKSLSIPAILMAGSRAALVGARHEESGQHRDRCRAPGR
jgi:hypothetical protein